MEKIEQKQIDSQTEKIYADKSAQARESLLSIYEQMPETESFEESSEFLKDIHETQKWREKHKESKFGSFYDFFEDISRVNKSSFSAQQKKEIIKNIIETASEKAGRFSPRVSDFYSAILSEAANEKYEARFKETAIEIEKLANEGVFYYLTEGEIQWEAKLNLMQSRLEGVLKGARAIDKREGKVMDDDIRAWREQELKKSPTRPSQRRNESQPGVDPMERLKEGEQAPAVWSIYPAWGGYYKEQSFSKWDNARNVWMEDEHTYSDIETIPLSGNTNPKKGPIDIIMSAKAFAGEWIALPVPYTHDLHKIEAGGRNYEARKDQNGDLVIFVEGSGEEVEINVFLAASPNKKFTAKLTEDVKTPNMPSEFSEETNKKLDEIYGEKRGNIARARTIKRYVVGRIKYLAPKDRAEADYYNNIYRTDSKGFAGAVDEVKTGDCDTVNTYFAALCAKLNVPVRHCVGHSVKGKDKEGFSNIHSGTGHGWSEVWDEIKKEWIRMDATPAGDPNLEEQEKLEGEAAPGDYGEQEAVRPTDEQLEELRKKLTERKEQLSYTKEERQLAENAGIELKEARQIVKEINEAEQTRLPNGELVVDALSRLFNAIIESRKTTASVYDGPVRKKEGGEAIQDIVRHKIGILSGETDPMSREKSEEEIKEEKLFDGFDLYLIGDKSGSMQSVSGEEKLWQMQRRVEYLVFSSLHRFERNIERAGLKKENALSVRTQGISFRGNGEDDIDLDKPLSPNFTAKDKVKMWHSLTEQGMNNGDPEALSYVYEQIKSEVEENKKKGIRDNRLRLVVACSDGGYVGDDAVQMQMLAQELHNLNANTVLIGVGLTETADAVSVVMDNPPMSRGDIARDINDLPAIVAKHIVLEAIKLFPEKAGEGVKQIIESSIAKFKNIK